MGFVAAHPVISSLIAASTAATGATVSQTAKKPSVPSAPDTSKLLDTSKTREAKKKKLRRGLKQTVLTTPLGDTSAAPVAKRTLIGSGL